MTVGLFTAFQIRSTCRHSLEFSFVSINIWIWEGDLHNAEKLSRIIMWTASSEFGTYRLCEQRRFRRACTSAQSRQNLRCSLIQAGSQEEPSDRKPDPWPLCMVGHAQLKFVMTECSKTQIHLTGFMWLYMYSTMKGSWNPKRFFFSRVMKCICKDVFATS